MSPEEKAEHRETQAAIDRIQRNGITLDDLELNHKRGFDEGFRLGCEQTFETTFAAICLALHELHGFGAKRCLDVLNLTHEKCYYALSRADAIAEVFDTIGLTINFRDVLPGNVVEMKEDDE